MPRLNAYATRQIQAIEKWVRAHLGILEHERRVREIAAKLYDLARPLHRLDSDYRHLLQMAALVHDVGRCVDDDSHPRQGARMLLEDARLPLTRADRRALAYLTRHHRGRVPDLGCDKILSRADDREALAITLALLRAADGLDSRCLDSPRLVFASFDRDLQITCYLDQDCPKARKAYTRRKKFRLLEDLLDCRVEVEVLLADSIHMVA